MRKVLTGTQCRPTSKLIPVLKACACCVELDIGHVMEPRRKRAYHLETSGTSSSSGTTSDTSSSSTTSSSSVQSKKQRGANTVTMTQTL